MLLVYFSFLLLPKPHVFPGERLSTLLLWAWFLFPQLAWSCLILGRFLWMHHWPQRAPTRRDDEVTWRIQRESGLHSKVTVQDPVTSRSSGRTDAELVPGRAGVSEAEQKHTHSISHQPFDQDPGSWAHTNLISGQVLYPRV